jgi:type IV pilus assembly protein PilV
MGLQQMGVIDMKTLKKHSTGFTMMEVLITMIIILLGLLGIVALQGKAQLAQLEAYQRTQAILIMQDIVDRMNASRVAVTCFTVTTNTTDGTPYLGEGVAAPTGCTASTTNYNNKANDAIAAIDAFLDGSAESLASLPAGAMTGARACISYDTTSEVGGPGTGYYQIIVAWQGLGDLTVPTVNCANNLYGDETRRRAVSTFIRFANLT